MILTHGFITSAAHWERGAIFRDHFAAENLIPKMELAGVVGSDVGWL